MQVHFSFPDGLVLFITVAAIPRQGETVDFSQINRPEFFESEKEYERFTTAYKLKVWKVHALSYRLTSDEKSAVIIELLEKEDSRSYSTT